jgi:hypothetical protein
LTFLEPLDRYGLLATEPNIRPGARTRLRASPYFYFLQCITAFPAGGHFFCPSSRRAERRQWGASKCCYCWGGLRGTRVFRAYNLAGGHQLASTLLQFPEKLRCFGGIDGANGVADQCYSVPTREQAEEMSVTPSRRA